MHVVAGVLKLFFRQLAVPVISADFYMDFIRTSGQFSYITPTALVFETVATLLVTLSSCFEVLCYLMAVDLHIVKNVIEDLFTWIQNSGIMISHSHVYSGGTKLI